MTFNAEQFMSQQTSGPLSTTVPQCREGEFKAMVDDGDKAITFNSGITQNGENKGNEWAKARVMIAILDDSVKAELKRDKVLVPLDLFLDVKADGTMDAQEGKNVGLGRLRTVLDQNDGTPWSWPMLKGKGPFMVKVTQRSDPKDPTIKYAEISRVAKIV